MYANMVWFNVTGYNKKKKCKTKINPNLCTIYFRMIFEGCNYINLVSSMHELKLDLIDDRLREKWLKTYLNLHDVPGYGLGNWASLSMKMYRI